MGIIRDSMTKIILFVFLTALVGVTTAEEEQVDSGEVFDEDDVFDRQVTIDRGVHFKVGSIRTNTAKNCQTICDAHDDCNYFRWKDNDNKSKRKFRRRCYLIKAVTDVKKRRQWTWGPKKCPPPA